MPWTHSSGRLIVRTVLRHTITARRGCQQFNLPTPEPPGLGVRLRATRPDFTREFFPLLTHGFHRLGCRRCLPAAIAAAVRVKNAAGLQEGQPCSLRWACS